MDLQNHTPFSTLAYDVLDVQGQEHHVLVARGTYDLVAAPAAAEGAGPARTPGATLARLAAWRRRAHGRRDGPGRAPGREGASPERGDPRAPLRGRGRPRGPRRLPPQPARRRLDRGLVRGRGGDPALARPADRGPGRA